MLVQSGVDYIYVDLTNLCTKSASEDLIQRRPMEILFEEWHKLRTQGKQTPQIVAWNRIDHAGNYFKIKKSISRNKPFNGKPFINFLNYFSSL